MEKKILAVEDEPGIAETLLYALKKEGFLALRAATISEAKSLFLAHDFSAIVLDVGLPDGSGFDFCKEVRKTSSVPIIFLTARNDEIDKIVGLEIGADDYVTKPFSPREVVARLNAIFRRVEVNEPPVENSKTSAFKLDEPKMKIFFQDTALELSRYEFGILKLLLKRQGQVYSRQQIMNSVWESPDMSLDRTVDTHIKTIRSKLRKLSEEDILITHRGVGYSIAD